MTCTANALEYYPGDNRPFSVIIKNEDGTRVPGLQTDVIEIIFQAKDDNNIPVIDLRFTNGEISVSLVKDSTDADQDVVTVSPTIASTQINPGVYDIFLRLSLSTPLNFTVDMIRGGVSLTKLIIKEGGVTP